MTEGTGVAIVTARLPAVRAIRGQNRRYEKMSALLPRNTASRPGLVGTAQVDRDIDRLLRRVGPGDVVVIDARDLDRVTADALIYAGVAAVINASPPSRALP